jgi:DNA-binding SARP family transcriptional activator/Tfp pilus assembly protein PilF
MPQLNLKLFGSPEVRLDQRSLEIGIKPIMLFALLALSDPERPFTRDRIASWLWFGKPNPLGNLSSALTKLRDLLGADAFGSDEIRRTLWLVFEVRCDVLEVRDDLASDDPLRWSHAWSRWPDAFLEFPDPRWDTRLDPEFQEWLLTQREVLHLERRELAARLAQGALERQAWVASLAYLEALPPEIEDPREQLAFYAMLVYIAQDQPDQALRIYHHLTDALSELGGKPSPDAEVARDLARDGATAAAKGLLEEFFSDDLEARDMPFVGRDLELKALASGVPGSLEGRAQAIILTGEPGAGKTEFARWLIKRLDPKRRAYLHAEGFSERLAPAWRTFDLVVRQLVRSRRRELEAMGGELRVALARFVPDLFDLGGGSAPLEDERLLFLAVRWLLTHDERPTLLFLDDLQWIDAPSLGLVLELLRKPPPRGLLLIATYRDTEGPESDEATRRLFEVIPRERLGAIHPIQALDAEAIAHLAQTLGREHVNAEWLQAQSGGNPLYALEMLEAEYLEPGELPPRLEALVQSRVGAIAKDTHARELLEACAVLGEGAGLTEVRAVAGLPFDETVRALGALREARLLRRGDAQVSFNHDLTAQATLHLIAPERAQLLHLQAAQARRHRPELAAAHYWAALGEGRETLPAEEMQAVVDAFGRAAMQQSLRGDPDGGAQWFSRTLELAPDATSRAVALTRRARVHERLLEVDLASKDLHQAEMLAGAVDPVTRARVLNAKGLLLASGFGDPDGAERASNAALVILENIQGPEALIERASAWSNLGVAAWQRHDLEPAERYHREALAVRRGLNELESVTASLQNLGLVFTLKGDATARTFFEEALAILEKLGNRAASAYVHANMGWLEWRLGALEEAERCFERAIAKGEPWGEDFNAHHIHNHIGAVRFLQGKYIQARESYFMALHSRSVAQHALNRAVFLGNLAEVELRLQLLDEVETHLTQAFELLAPSPNPALEADLHYFKGDELALRGHFAAARTAFTHSLDCAKTANKSEREAESLVRLARLDGNITSAREALTFTQTPMLEASVQALEGDIEGAITLLEVASDWYEAGRLALDLWYRSGLETWHKRAEACFQRL